MDIHKLKEYIADLFNHGLSNREVEQYIASTTTLIEFGRMVQVGDLIAVIRQLMDEVPDGN